MVLQATQHDAGLAGIELVHGGRVGRRDSPVQESGGDEPATLVKGGKHLHDRAGLTCLERNADPALSRAFRKTPAVAKSGDSRLEAIARRRFSKVPVGDGRDDG